MASSAAAKRSLSHGRRTRGIRDRLKAIPTALFIHHTMRQTNVLHPRKIMILDEKDGRSVNIGGIPRKEAARNILQAIKSGRRCRIL
jgi:hypothetical protein